MNVKATAKKQAAQQVNQAAGRLQFIHKPKGGWLALMREALGMSGADVAGRMGVSRAAVHQAERNEKKGAITIAQMQKIADAMDAEFVYAVVPKETVEQTIYDQARKLAERRVKRAGMHMALESQALTPDQMARRIDALAEDLVRDMPRNFWDVV